MLDRFICKQAECQMVYSAQNNALRSKDGIHCDKCGTILVRREDDNRESIRERLRIYHKYAYELLEFYRSSGRAIYEMNVVAPLLMVFDTFVRTIVQKADISMSYSA